LATPQYAYYYTLNFIKNYSFPQLLALVVVQDASLYRTLE